MEGDFRDEFLSALPITFKTAFSLYLYLSERFGCFFFFKSLVILELDLLWGRDCASAEQEPCS